MKANSGIGLYTPDIRLFHSCKKYKRYVKREFGCEVEIYHTGAQTTYCDGFAAVLMEATSNDPTTELSLLVHEAYHVADKHMEYLGEEHPGDEVMAYLVQTVSDGLMKAHLRWNRRKGRIMTSDLPTEAG